MPRRLGKSAELGRQRRSAHAVTAMPKHQQLEILDLPDLVLESIFKKLSFKDLHSCRLTCHRLQRVIDVSSIPLRIVLHSGNAAAVDALSTLAQLLRSCSPGRTVTLELGLPLSDTQLPYQAVQGVLELPEVRHSVTAVSLYASICTLRASRATQDAAPGADAGAAPSSSASMLADQPHGRYRMDAGERPGTDDYPTLAGQTDAAGRMWYRMSGQALRHRPLQSQYRATRAWEGIWLLMRKLNRLQSVRIGGALAADACFQELAARQLPLLSNLKHLALVKAAADAQPLQVDLSWLRQDVEVCLHLVNGAKLLGHSSPNTAALRRWGSFAPLGKLVLGGATLRELTLDHLMVPAGLLDRVDVAGLTGLRIMSCAGHVWGCDSDSPGLLYSVLQRARQLRSLSCTRTISDGGPVEMRSRLELGRLLQMQGVTGKLWEMLPPSLTVLDIRTSGFERTALAHLTALQSLSLQRVGAGQRSWSALDEPVPEMCSRCCLHGFSLMPQPCLSRQQLPQPMPGAFSWTTRLQSLELQRCVLGARQKLPESLEKLTFSSCLLNPLHLPSRLRSLCISRCGFAQPARRPRTAGGTADPGDPGYSLPKLHLPAQLQHLDFTTCHEFGLTQWPRAVVLKSAGCDFLAASCWGHGSDRSVCLCASSANGRSSASAAAARPAALQSDSSSDSSADGMDCSPDTPAAKMVVDVPDLVFPPDSALKEVSVARRCWLVVRQLPKSLCGLNLHEHNYGMDDTSAFPEGGAAPGVINLTSFTSLTKLHLAGQRAHFLLPAQPLDMLVAMLDSSSSVLVGLPPLPCRPLPALDLPPRLPLRHPADRPARKRQRRGADSSAAAAPQRHPVAAPPTRFQYSKVVLYRYKSTLHSGGSALQTSLLSWPTALHIAHLSLRGFHHDDLSDASLSHIKSLSSVVKEF